jgi:V8-like Glu-specific endopeptidase
VSDWSSKLASRARRELPDIDAVIDELAAPSHVLARLPGRTGAVRTESALEGMAAVAESADAPIAQALDDGRRAAVKVRATADPSQVSLTPDEQIGLEAVILLFGRPALLVQHGTFGPPPAGWEVLDSHRAAIETAIRSVGRIELFERGMVGTGFLVAPGVIMTNRHVAEVFAVPSDQEGWTFKLGRVPVLDYLDERGGTGSATFKVKEVIGIHPDVRIDLALLRLEDDAMDETPAGWTAPAALPIAATPPVIGNTEHNVYLIGYPASDNQGITPPDVMTRIFGDVFEVKRLQPGTITQMSSSIPRFSHDCSTLGGNSGSCVIDLETQQVIGLHFSGGYRESNYAVALWKLTTDQLLAGAGVQFA